MGSRQPKRSQAEQKKMIRDDALYRGPWYYNHEKHTLINAKEEAIEASNNAVAEFEKPPKSTTECLFLKLLPLEIRQKIYRLLLVRPTGTVPTFIRYENLIAHRNTSLTLYMYQWEHQRQCDYEPYGIPKYDGSPQSLQLAWRSKLDLHQRALIDSGAVTTKSSLSNEMSLPPWHSEELDAEITPDILYRGNFPTELINRASVISTGLQGIYLLTTCKQVHAEAATILYGENKWIFDTRGQWPFTHQYGVHNHDELDYTPKNATHLIPGLPSQDGTLMSRRQINEAIEQLFKKDVYLPPFMFRDPLTKFFRQIGRFNAGFMKRVVIEGFFRTAENNPQYREGRPLGLASILPIHTTILNKVCPELRELTLHQGDGRELWDDDLDGVLGMTDEEQVDDVVGKVANALPGLQKLVLGNWLFAPEERRVVGAWGTALRWEKVVEDQFLERKRLQQEKEHQDARRKETRELERYIWKDDKRGSQSAARENAFALLVDNAVAAAPTSNSKKGKKRLGKDGKEGNDGPSITQ